MKPYHTTTSESVFSKYFLFVKRQTEQVRRGGIKVFFRKLSTMIKFYRVIHVALFFIPLLPFIFIVRLMRPVLLFRFGGIVNQRLGHYAANTELYLCERDAGLQPQEAFDIFFNLDPSFNCNRQLEKMWKRCGRLHIWEVGRYLYITNRCVPGYRKHMIALPSDRDIHDLYKRFPVHISFTPEEENEGYSALRRMGIPEGAKFICFHSRDSAYLNAVFPGGGYYYHDHRDSDIEDFMPAVESLSKRGYYAVRMGAIVKKPLKTDNPFIIDYATRFRTEFLDIFLGAKCAFHLGDACGMNGVPFIFRRPLATTNSIPLEYIYTWSHYDISIPKKLWLRKEGRLMTFPEILESGVGRYLEAEQYEAAGIDVIQNSPEEITELAVEMDERLTGTYMATEEDEGLQKRFWALFRPSDLNKAFNARIGTDFLRKNQNLLL
jgi:putative glycosyltransferase (TIGR04372 family)